MIITIIYFFLMTFGLGYSLLRLLKRDFEDPYESFVMKLGVGLGVFPILSIVLNTLYVPLHYIVFLVLALFLPVTDLVGVLQKKSPGLVVKKWFEGILEPIKNLGKGKLTLKKETLYFLGVLICSLLLLFVFLKGAFAYEYLEDDDPYMHAEGVKYVALHNTYTVPEGYDFAKYLEPYPPTYDVLIGVLHQLNNDLSWTLKFFNTLLVALSILFFFYFVHKLTKNRRLSFIAAFVLAILPSYLSHFIWAQGYALILFPVALYFLIEIYEKNGKEKVSSFFKKEYGLVLLYGIVAASIYVIQPTYALFFLITSFVFFVGFSITSRKIEKTVFAVILVGLLFSQVYWAPTLVKFQGDDSAETITFMEQGIAFFSGKAKTLRIGESTTPTYTVKQFMHAPKVDKMDQPTGFGEVVFFLFLVGVVVLLDIIIKARGKDMAANVTLLFLLFAFVGVQGNALPIHLNPHRFWCLLAMPVAIICGIGGERGLSLKKIPKKVKVVLALALLIGIGVTSGYPKYYLETSMWPPGVDKWTSAEQMAGYVHLKHNYHDMKVFPVCENDNIVIAFNQLSFSWDKDVKAFREQLPQKSFEEFITFLRMKGYEYYTITSNCLANEFFVIGEEKTKELLEKNPNVVFNNAGFYLVKVP